MTEIINNNFNKNIKTLIVFLDLAEEFDSVPNEILLHKLQNCVVRGPTQDLIENYLRDRTQILILIMLVTLEKPLTLVFLRERY